MMRSREHLYAQLNYLSHPMLNTSICQDLSGAGNECCSVVRAQEDKEGLSALLRIDQERARPLKFVAERIVLTTLHISQEEFRHM